MDRIYVDPSIRSCAQSLLIEAIEDVNRRVSCGDSFWIARTRVLEMHADEWVRLYVQYRLRICAQRPTDPPADRTPSGLRNLRLGEA